MGAFGGWRGEGGTGERGGWREWASIGRRSSTAALSYENLIVSHTKANRLSILRERLSLSDETAEWFARVAPASLQLPPSGMFSLFLTFFLSLLTLALSIFLFLSNVCLTLSCYPSRYALFPLAFFLSVLQIKMHRGIFKLMHLSLFLCATSVRKAINLSISIISCVGSFPFLSDQLLMALMVIESLKNLKLIFFNERTVGKVYYLFVTNF